MYPQIYLGDIPTSAPERQALRGLAIELRARIHAARLAEPIVLLLHFAPTALPPVDLLLLSPHTALVGVVRAYRAAVLAQPGGRWSYRDSGAPIVEAGGLTPMQLVAAQRDHVRALLGQGAPLLAEPMPTDRLVGALICAPVLHPDSRISLDIGEHRRQLKVLGLDELPGLVPMLRSGAQLAEPAMRAITGDLLGGRLWHDGARFLFDLAAPRFQLRVLPNGTRAERTLPLNEGDTIIGRRRAPLQNEHRMTIAGDELISADHVVLICGEGDQIVVRDISKNGTWVSGPAGEERIRSERALAPGAQLRIGITQVRLERAGE